MQYRENKKGEKLSILGLGCMRLPTVAGKVDYKKAKAMIDFAIENGVNYFDTAYIYHGGQSEAVLGRALEGQRDKVNIATKLPQYLVRKREQIDKYFDTQLERLKTTYIDYYLMHMMRSLADWERLVECGIVEWIADKKEKGIIRNIGFSFHGAQEEFIKLVDAYEWDFCQIQYNYLDEGTQAGKVGLEYAHSKGLPLIIMEPLLGGQLARKQTADIEKVFAGAKVKRSNAEWGLRWVWNHIEVKCVLSGMSNMEQLSENINIASVAEANSLTDSELEIFEKVKKINSAKRKIPCTGCHYCMPCPKNVDIPGNFYDYNNLDITRFSGKMKHLGFKSGITGGAGSGANKCIACRKCVVHCPQGIDIPTEMVLVKKKLEGGLYRAVTFIIRK